MRLADTVAALDIADKADALRAGWDESLRSLPGGNPPFLESDFVRWACETSGLAADLLDKTLETANRIAKSRPLATLAWYCHERLYGAKDREVDVGAWPLPIDALGDLAGFFYIVVLLSGTRRLLDFHRERGVPPEVTRQTLGSLEGCIRTVRENELGETLGINAPLLRWLALN